MFCNYCGAKHPDGAFFCQRCGRRVETKNQSESKSTSLSPPSVSIATSQTSSQPSGFLSLALSPKNRPTLWMALGSIGTVLVLVGVALFVLRTSQSPAGTLTISGTLTLYCNALKSGDYHAAYNQLVSNVKSQEPEAEWTSHVHQALSSADSITGCVVSDVQQTGSSANGKITYTFNNGDPPVTNDIQLVEDNDQWKILTIMHPLLHQAGVSKTITHINPSVLASVGTGSASNLMKPITGASPLIGPTGKPEFFYTGAEYCPFCAAQRWAIIVALGRFGAFSNVSQITSSQDNISTFTFHKSTYKSQYIDFVPVEASDNQGNPLEQLAPDQQQLLTTYDAPPYTDVQSKGSIPFTDIANRLISSGSYYSPNVLVGHSWEDIATQIQDPDTDISKGVLGTANYLTAAICLATGNQPASVCAADPIPQIEGSLPKG